MTPDEIIAGLPEEEQAAPVEAAEEPIAESPAEEVSAEAVPVEEAPVEVAPAEEAAAEETPAAPAPKKKMKKKRHPAIRVLCGFLGTILVILMIIPAFLGLTVANLQNITSQAVISQILNGILTSAPVESPFPALRAPLTAGVGTAPGDLDVGDIDIGDLTGENSTDFVVDIVYDIIQDQFGGQVEVTKEEMSDFLEESTAKDFVVEKVSGLVSDMINGTNNTTITIEEINTLVEENAQLIEDHFDIVITEEQKDMVSQVVEDSGVLDAIEKDGLLGVIEQMTTVPDTDAPGSGEGSDSGNGDAQAPSKPNAGGLGGMMETITMIREALEMFRQVASTQNLLICIGVFLFMSLLVFFLNNMGIPGTLVGMGIPVLLVGGLYSAPSIIAVNAPDMIIGMLAENMEGGALVGKAVVTALAAIMPLNVTVMCVGAGMIVLAIVLKIILSQKAKKAALAA